MSKPRKTRLFIDEPNMSDSTILMKVDDLISIAMGPPDKNVVNFKLLQAILYILARQMRLLEQHVEIRITHLRHERSSSSESISEVVGSPAMKSPQSEDRKKTKPKAKSERDTPGPKYEASSRQEEGKEKPENKFRKDSKRQGIENKESARDNKGDEKTLHKERYKEDTGQAEEREGEERPPRTEKYMQEIYKTKDKDTADESDREPEDDEKSTISDQRGKDSERRKDERDKSSERYKERAESEGKRDRHRQESPTEDAGKVRRGGKLETSRKDKEWEESTEREENQPKRLRRDKGDRSTERKKDEDETRKMDREEPVRTDKISSGREKDRPESAKDRQSDRGKFKKEDTRDTGRDSESDQSVFDRDQSTERKRVKGKSETTDKKERTDKVRSGRERDRPEIDKGRQSDRGKFEKEDTRDTARDSESDQNVSDRDQSKERKEDKDQSGTTDKKKRTDKMNLGREKDRPESDKGRQSDKEKTGQDTIRDTESSQSVSERDQSTKRKSKKDKRGTTDKKEKTDRISSGREKDRPGGDKNRQSDRVKSGQDTRRDSESDQSISEKDKSTERKIDKDKSGTSDKKERTDRISSGREKDRPGEDKSRKIDRLKTEKEGKRDTGRDSESDQSVSERDQSKDRSSKKSDRDKTKKDVERISDRDKPERDPQKAKDQSKRDREISKEHKYQPKGDVVSSQSEETKSPSRDTDRGGLEEERNKSERDIESPPSEKGTTKSDEKKYSKKDKSTSRERERAKKDWDRPEKDDAQSPEKSTSEDKDRLKEDRDKSIKDTASIRSGKDKSAQRAGAQDELEQDSDSPEKDAETWRSQKGKATSRDRDADRSKRDAESLRPEGEKSREMDEAEKRTEEKGQRGKEKERGRPEKAPGKKSSATSIAISEVERQNEKLLAVDRVPTKRPAGGAPTRVGSIEVVTQSQFKLLEQAVRSLEEKAAPMPLPTLPDNKKLRADIAKGSASLTDTMQAMQISARVQAAETAIGRLTELMTQLAATGALPEDLADKAIDIKAEVQSLAKDAQKLEKNTQPLASDAKSRKFQEKNKMSPKDETDSSVKKGPKSTLQTETPSSLQPASGGHRDRRKSVSIDEQSAWSKRPAAALGAVDTSSGLTKRKTFISPESEAGSVGVTPEKLDEALLMLRDDLFNYINETTTKSTISADAAMQTARAVAQKMELVLKLDSRVLSLGSLLADYSQQLNGFDSGVARQMQGFQSQIQQMRDELTAGLQQLQQTNNDAESPAVTELMQRFEGLVGELDSTVHEHNSLANFQKDLNSELKSLVECVEMLREQKADREEVLDGLRDKADLSRLAGLMTEDAFRDISAVLEGRIRACHEKFFRQDQAWMRAIKDFSKLMDTKAQYLQLEFLREDMQKSLQAMQEKVQRLTRLLGDPKAAVLTRKLARDATCAACRGPALMSPRETPRPPALPPARAPPPADRDLGAGPDDVCLTEWAFEEPPEGKIHMCHRWVGGSHTLVSNSVTKEQAPALQVQIQCTKRYIGPGVDGRMYNLEEDLQPCVECNQVAADKERIPGEADHAPTPVGAGDQVNVINADDARRVTVVHEEGLKRAAVVDGDRMKPTQPLGNMATLSKSAMAFLARGSAAHFEDTPRRQTIGNVIRGRSMVIDDSAVLRTVIRQDAAARRATLLAEELKRAVAQPDPNDEDSDDENYTI